MQDTDKQNLSALPQTDFSKGMCRGRLGRFSTESKVPRMLHAADYKNIDRNPPLLGNCRYAPPQNRNGIRYKSAFVASWSEQYQLKAVFHIWLDSYWIDVGRFSNEHLYQHGGNIISAISSFRYGSIKMAYTYLPCRSISTNGKSRVS